MKEKRKRKKLPSKGKPRYVRFMLLILTYNLLIILFLGAAIFLPDMIQMGTEDTGFMDRGEAASRMLVMHARVWPGIIVLLLLIGIHSFRSFHRVLGPLHRFQDAFEQMTQGNFFLRIKLRKRDLLGSEQKAFNIMMDTLGEKLTASQRSAQEAVASLNALEETVVQRGEDPALQKQMEDLRSKLRALSGDLAFFQTKGQTPETAPNVKRARRRGLNLE